MSRVSRTAILFAAGLILTGAAEAQTPTSVPPEVRALHERLLTLDTHLDTPAQFVRPGWSILDRHTVEGDQSQVDYPRLVEGGLDGGFWAIYTPQGPRTPEATEAAYQTALERARLIHGLVDNYPDKFGLALKAEDAAPIAASGRRVVFLSIENGWPLGARPDALQTFYDQGVRLLGLAHFLNNEYADSATDPAGPEWHGLSPAGRALVAEANRLGIVLDASHSSDDVFDQLLTVSATPILLSHSGARDVYDHPRNINDARLKALAAHGGVIQINAYGAYLKTLSETPERKAALAALRDKYGPVAALSADQREAYSTDYRKVNQDFPPAQADFEDFIAHLLHTLVLIGPQHVGIGADWDGGGGVTGLPDITALPRITERLLAEGYSEADIQAIWSGNALRVLKRAEDYAAEQRAKPGT
jgi:membrane dipeptidase